VGESLTPSGENLPLILDDRIESTLVLENANLILQRGRVGGGRDRIRPGCSLIGDDGLLILDNRLPISDRFAFGHRGSGND